MAKKNMTQYNVMVGTCSDVDESQFDRVIIDAINDWNHADPDSNIYFMPKHWKIDVAPSSGDRPQGIINKQIVDTSDVLIVFLWTQVGAGVEEEIERFLSAGKPVMVYIYQGHSKPILQIPEINSFKEKYGGRTLFHDRIENKNDIEKQIQRGLSQSIQIIKECGQKEINNKLSKEFHINDSEEFVIVDHAFSKYETENIEIRDCGCSFIWDIPEEFKKLLIQKKFIQGDQTRDATNRPYSTVKMDNSLIKDRLLSFLNTNFKTIIDIDAFLANIARKTALFFLEKEGTNCFNGTTLGVYQIDRNRTIQDEKPIVDMKLYSSDYFTFRFMSILYQELKQINKDAFVIKSLADIHRLVPFFNSIGIGGFVCFHKGDNLEFLFSKRAPTISCSGLWHFTFDETFSLIDQRPVGGYWEFDPEACLERALKEEVGITNMKSILKNNTNYGFSDFGVICSDDRLEFEICGYVYINFNERFSYDDLVEKYKIAPDANWETTAMAPVKFDKINDFIKNNKTTPECEVFINRLQLRIKSGSIIFRRN